MIFINKNIKTGFKGIKISPYNPDSIISKLNNYLCTPTPSKSHSSIGRNWEL